MPKIYLDDAFCTLAKETMREIKQTEQNAPGNAIRQRAASDAMRHCLTQERYNLKPQDAGDYQRAVNYPRSNAEELENMTPEQLLEYQRQLVAAEWKDDD